jgi:hypothetical protein
MEDLGGLAFGRDEDFHPHFPQPQAWHILHPSMIATEGARQSGQIFSGDTSLWSLNVNVIGLLVEE